jgi:hypothetical protein
MSLYDLTGCGEAPSSSAFPASIHASRRLADTPQTVVRQGLGWNSSKTKHLLTFL